MKEHASERMGPSGCSKRNGETGDKTVKEHAGERMSPSGCSKRNGDTWGEQ